MKIELREYECACELWLHLMDVRQWGTAEWAFRGQTNSRWGLVPSALREGELDRFLEQDDLHLPQIEKELLVLAQFAGRCDLGGLASGGGWEVFPEAEIRFKKLSIAGKKYDLTAWPVPECERPMALAQHLGIPTRLLDWSARPAVAAYFAATGAVNHLLKALREEDDHRVAFANLSAAVLQDASLAQAALDAELRRRTLSATSGSLAIWAVRLSTLAELTKSRAEGRVRVVHGLKHENPRLHAQVGLFSLVTGEDPLDQIIESLPCEQQGTAWPVAVKCTLPWHEGPELQSIIEKMVGVSELSLFGDYEAVVRSQEHAARRDALLRQAHRISGAMGE